MGVLRTVIGLIMCEGERQEDFLVGHFPFITKKKICSLRHPRDV